MTLSQEISNGKIGRSKVSEILPAMKMIALDWGLNLSKARHWNTARKILVKSVNCN